jgi:regulator of sigma E protease
LREFRRKRPSTRVFAIGSAMLGVGADLEGPCTLTSVYAASGAYEAGLAQGDEILSVDGQKTRDFSDLTISVFARKPGEKVAIEFKRSGQVRTVDVLLKDRAVLEAEARP